MISTWTLGSGAVLTPRRLVYTPGEVACGAYCVGALRRDCARAGEAIDAIMAIITAMQICLIAPRRCEPHLVRCRGDCNHSDVHAHGRMWSRWDTARGKPGMLPPSLVGRARRGVAHRSASAGTRGE